VCYSDPARHSFPLLRARELHVSVRGGERGGDASCHRTLRKAILYPVWVALGDDMRRRHVMGCPCCACCRRH
jgi:hypothetical protein